MKSTRGMLALALLAVPLSGCAFRAGSRPWAAIREGGARVIIDPDGEGEWARRELAKDPRVRIVDYVADSTAGTDRTGSRCLAATVKSGVDFVIRVDVSSQSEIIHPRPRSPSGGSSRDCSFWDLLNKNSGSKCAGGGGPSRPDSYDAQAHVVVQIYKPGECEPLSSAALSKQGMNYASPGAADAAGAVLRDTLASEFASFLGKRLARAFDLHDVHDDHAVIAAGSGEDKGGVSDGDVLMIVDDDNHDVSVAGAVHVEADRSTVVGLSGEPLRTGTAAIRMSTPAIVEIRTPALWLPRGGLLGVGVGFESYRPIRSFLWGGEIVGLFDPGAAPTAIALNQIFAGYIMDVSPRHASLFAHVGGGVASGAAGTATPRGEVVLGTKLRPGFVLLDFEAGYGFGGRVDVRPTGGATTHDSVAGPFIRAAVGADFE